MEMRASVDDAGDTRGFRVVDLNYVSLYLESHVVEFREPSGLKADAVLG